MTRQKIVFLIVLGAVGLFIAAMVGSMFATKQTLSNGYEVSVGGRGEIWLRSKAHQALVDTYARLTPWQIRLCR